MRKFLLRRPSPALVVSVVALVLALGGSAYAAFKLPKNSVGSKQIKNGAVVNSKIANGAVGTAKIKNGAVTSSKLNTSGLTVPNASHASSADSATTATNAGNANTVGGQTVSKIFANLAPGTGITPVFSADGLTLSAECNGSGNDELGVFATSTDPNAELNYEGNEDGSFVEDEDENTGTGQTNLFDTGTASGDNQGNIVLNFSTTAGKVVTVELGTDYDGAFDSGSNCGVWGTATSSS